MHEIKVDKQNSKLTIRLTGALTIQNALAIKEVLLKSLNEAESILLIYEKVEEFDLSYLQLLISLYKSAKALGKTITINKQLPESFIQCMKDSGLPYYSWIVGESKQENVGVNEYD